MIKQSTLFIACAFFTSLYAIAQDGQIITTHTPLTPLATTEDTGDKPQSKVWSFACSQWAVFPDAEGTHVWRLDGTTWTKVLKLSGKQTTKADCKVVGKVTHILLFAQGSTTQLLSVEYMPGSNTYQLWKERPDAVDINLEKEAETATIDIDGTGRMWLASDATPEVRVRWSDVPYTDWSAPITVATGIEEDDIAAVVALPKQIGVMWSNKDGKRFGYRAHADGAAPTAWSADEVPAFQSGLPLRKGMADDHLNMAVARDGTLYVAVKTNYEAPGLPSVALLIRRSSGKWDDLYEVSGTGSRPIVLLNEEVGMLKIVYTAADEGGNILYKESSTANISFGPETLLIEGNYNDATSSKDNYTYDAVILASNKTHVVGVHATVGAAPASCRMLNKLIAAPNPFLTQTTIFFSVPEGGKFLLQLFDGKGAYIMTILEGTAEEGVLNAIPLDARELPAGLYIARLKTSYSTRSLKLVYVP
ncbi:T9SS type A sorting domain-containing protein [Pontibacter akesuensis]|uniref:Por secretion system C-terminal sorting domain-containing protein n=1 Tax=Pontibacter akesuensis TaxID=388950 RepID=A0A1I7J2D5_9BACT|nr:T9SS type A sorting domain-containing protein [Pontibacter akesuensis]GHA72804.1 hypothetical protein GCM10007389_28290 [Pontibacter akesuensis]SFU79358.1 Por secretion system C-terminal sorting domain-containing protein [Pontibacter akesuensis]